ncbi:hypothetical protein JOE11_001101 [Robbsia andropogonis]|uniref:hypothetical protein n=2 Tax=Robbsia andropogonis TaxID=28092 RepID=UPI00069799A5|nr:hypothetical protein [Robbsia andropogonis]MCP1121112.1 hypothetical protein [Robbsia andropogonis]MCP1130888.1 hypothetical protein [Robbsia andropogonis]
MSSSGKPARERAIVSTLDVLASALRLAMADVPGNEDVTGVHPAASDMHPQEATSPQFTLSLLTTGVDGWPVTSLLGPGEVVVVGEVQVRIALWPTARANSNIVREERATLDFVFDGHFHQLRLRALRRAPLVVDASAPTLVCHELLLVEGEAQKVPYAELTSGIRYRLTGDAACRRETAVRWRVQQAALTRFAMPSAE